KTFGKRAIKITTSNNRIIGNRFENIEDDAYVVIGLIGSSNNLIDGNVYNVKTRLAIISISNSHNNKISNNKIIFHSKEEYLIYVKNVFQTSILSNEFEHYDNIRFIRYGDVGKSTIDYENTNNFFKINKRW